MQKGISPQWLAGFFDGEGCVCSKMEHGVTSRKSYSFRVSITQKDPEVLYEILSLFPGGTIRKIKRVTKSGRGTTVHTVEWLGTKSKPILEFMLPYLKVKFDVAFYGLELCNLITHVGGKLSDDAFKKRMFLHGKIKGINELSRATEELMPPQSETVEEGGTIQ